MKTSNKKGNVIVALGITISILIFLCFFLLYYQINTISNSIKSDLFYISNNTIVAMDKEYLSYGNYRINVEKSKNIIETLLKKNHEKGYVKEISIRDISFETDYQKTIVHIIISVKFVPLIAIGNKDEYEITMKENTRISLLQYN